LAFIVKSKHIKPIDRVETGQSAFRGTPAAEPICFGLTVIPRSEFRRFGNVFYVERSDVSGAVGSKATAEVCP
jgi:hypothetical protein